MFRRKAFGELLAAKNEGCRRILLRGPPRVGKTSLAECFARSGFPRSAYVDLQPLPDRWRRCGGEELAGTIRERMLPDADILVLDGMHRAEGSLEAVSILSDEGFPILAVSDLPFDAQGVFDRAVDLKPMDFEEFLWALGRQDPGIRYFRSVILDRREGAPLSVLDNLFRDFAMVGGMPSAVSAFMEGGYAGALNENSRILAEARSRLQDPRAVEALDSVPAQLAAPGRRFSSAAVCGDPKNGSRRCARALHALEEHGAVLPCPLEGGTGRRLMLNDSGLLLSSYGREAASDLLSSFDGPRGCAVLENCVACCMDRAGIAPRQKDLGGRRGTVFLYDGTAIEIGPMSGRASPLDGIEGFERIRLDGGGTRTDDRGIRHLPLWAAGFFTDIR